jgi:hypothetical protein
MSDKDGVQTKDQIVIEPVTSEDSGTPMGLGSRVAARFRQVGFEEEIQELRGYPAVPADFDP